MSTNPNIKTYTVGEGMDILKTIIHTNNMNRKNGITNKNIALEFIGEKGIGKSQSIEEFAKKNGYAFVKRELAQITDETSLLGYPRKTYRLQKKVIEKVKKSDDTVQEVTRLHNKKVELAELKRHLDEGWTQVSKDSELSYSTPEWVNDLAKTETSILLLDEMKRRNELFQ